MNQKQMKEFMKALNAIAEEKKIDKNVVVEAMEQAMAAAYKKNEGLTNVMAKVDDVTGDIRIYSYKTVVETVEKKPEKLKKVRNFLNYYLPVTIKILERYDEIENQKLTTKESKKFMSSVENMIEKIKDAFEEQLSNIYQTEMVDTDAELKVFESMLKADGFLDEIDFNIEKKDKEV